MTQPLHVISAALAAAGLFLAAAPARADVLEIDENGEVIVHAAPRPAPPMPAPPPALRRVTPLTPLIQAASEEIGVSAELIEAIAATESSFNARAVSPKGAQGVMQLMPATARMLGVDPRDPAQNIRGGATYLKAMLLQFDGDLVLALAAYNAGPGAVRRHGGVPPYAETQAYVEKVLSRLAALTEANR